MIREAQGIAVKSVVGKPALVKVNRKERGRKPTRPFNQRIKRGTFTNYTT
jgi:hypothetical protein